MECNVNHPKHYNSNKSGIECIEIIRWYYTDIGNAFKYLWRCGLKEDSSMTPREKEDEDLRKSLWYIDDRIKQLKMYAGIHGYYDNTETFPANCEPEVKIYHPSGYEVIEFSTYYNKDIDCAMRELWYCGLLTHHIEHQIEIYKLQKAKRHIEDYLNRPCAGDERKVSIKELLKD